MEKAENSEKIVTFVEEESKSGKRSKDKDKDKDEDEDEEKKTNKKRLRSHSTELKLGFIGKDIEDERYSRKSPTPRDSLLDGIDQNGTYTT